MSASYEIKTLTDMHAIPEESIGAFLIDLGAWLVMCREVKDTKNIKMIRAKFTWVDDGVEGLGGLHVVGAGEE